MVCGLNEVRTCVDSNAGKPNMGTCITTRRRHLSRLPSHPAQTTPEVEGRLVIPDGRAYWGCLGPLTSSSVFTVGVYAPGGGRCVVR